MIFLKIQFVKIYDIIIMYKFNMINLQSFYFIILLQFGQ